MRWLAAGLLAWLGALGAVPQSGPPAFPNGQILERVQSATSPTHHFTLYLPTSYDRNTPAPVMFLMDPRRRARVPVELFRDAAERYGYILLSSHDTISDESMEPNLRAVQAMWSDAHAWFRVDDRRVYLGGFSGTARTAWLLARHLSGTFTGVIGAAAGPHPDYPPEAGFRFVYFGTAGRVDYNYYEMLRFEEQLAAAGFPHRIGWFDGPHGWMPPALAMRAVEFLELRAMQAGSRAGDAALVEAWWRRDEAEAGAYEAAGDPLRAAWRYAAMARDYDGLRETADAATRAAAVAARPASRALLDRRRRAFEDNRIWVDNAMIAITEAYRPGAAGPAVPVDQLARELEILRLRALTVGTDVEAAREAQQRLNAIEVQLGFYLPREAIERTEYLRAAYYLELAGRIDARSPTTWYLTAVARARLREPEAAVAALARAIDCGYRDVAQLNTEAAFRALRDAPAFAAEVERLRHLTGGR